MPASVVGKSRGSNAVQNAGGELCFALVTSSDLPFLTPMSWGPASPSEGPNSLQTQAGWGLGSLSWTSAHLAVSSPAPGACPQPPSREQQHSQPVPKATPSPAGCWDPGPRRTNQSLSPSGECQQLSPALWVTLRGWAVRPLSRDGGQARLQPTPRRCEVSRRRGMRGSSSQWLKSPGRFSDQTHPHTQAWGPQVKPLGPGHSAGCRLLRAGGSGAGSRGAGV